MDKINDLLKIISTQILNYANYHIAIESIAVDDDNVEYAPFFEYNNYKFDTHTSEEEGIYILQLSDVNITDAISVTNNIGFGINLAYLIEDSTINEVAIEITNFDFKENGKEDFNIKIKDFFNNYLKYVLSGIDVIISEYDTIVHKDDENVVLKFVDKISISYALEQKNGITMSIKSLFVNDVDLIYELNYSDKLKSEFSDYSSELQQKINEILGNSGNLVTELYAYDNEMFQINTDVLKERFEKTINKGEISTNALLLKNILYQSIMRTGSATASNMLSLYDDSDYLSVSSVIFKIDLDK